jgi:hypothetical protein
MKILIVLMVLFSGLVCSESYNSDEFGLCSKKDGAIA